MPNQPKNKHRMVRFSDEEWEELGDRAASIGSDRSAVIRRLVADWLGHPGAGPPPRPSPPAGADGFKVPVIADDLQPPGTFTLVSAWEENGELKMSGATAFNIGPDETETPAAAEDCGHPRVHGKGTCPDCFEWVPGKRQSQRGDGGS
jgi:hypothetical protein